MKLWRVILAVVVIFGAGVVTGGLIARSTLKPAVAVAPQPPTPMPGGPPGTGIWVQSRAQFVSKMHRQLDLTPDQCKQVDAIMKVGHEHMAKLWEPIAPQAREETKNVRMQIQAILTPQQLTKFDEVFKPHRRPENWKKEHPADTNSVAIQLPSAQTNDSSSLKVCAHRDAAPDPILFDCEIAEDCFE